MKKEKIARVRAERYINNTGGRFFTAVFTKKDGSDRVLNGRLGVTAHLKGGDNKVVKPSNSYVTVYDVHKKEYRTLNLATLKEIHTDGKIYTVVG